MVDNADALAILQNRSRAKSDPNIDKNTGILKNLVGAKTQAELDRLEKFYTLDRLNELKSNPVKGKFDDKHLQAIHREIFQDVYPFAGKSRTVDISKDEEILRSIPAAEIKSKEPGGESVFSVHYPPVESSDSMQTLKSVKEYEFGELSKTLKKKGAMDEPLFLTKLVKHSAAVWETHQFREGNTRTSLTFMAQFSKHMGHELDQSDFGNRSTRDALALATFGKTDKLREIMSNAMAKGKLLPRKAIEKKLAMVAEKDKPAAQELRSLYQAGKSFAKENSSNKTEANRLSSQIFNKGFTAWKAGKEIPKVPTKGGGKADDIER
ncbi:MAG: hypothetical protein HOM11_06000 [Methylococcales bacterium]|jgi:cell filamentation protein|nr:hypothetical protein [Methylococcales bacterium]